MSEDLEAVAKMCAITISREYGSGGGEVAAQLAHRLGWQLIDHEAVIQIARDLGMSEKEAQARDERSASFLVQILTRMQGVEPSISMDAPPEGFTDGREYHEALERVVDRAAQQGHIVLVGRASQVLLAQKRDVLHVRIVAALEQRIPYIMRREGLNEDAARKRIRDKDRDRERYLQTEYNRHPGDAHLYDLIINTTIIDLDSTVDMICLALERKARRLSVPLEELGPGVGLSRYPGQPADLHPPQQ